MNWNPYELSHRHFIRFYPCSIFISFSACLHASPLTCLLHHLRRPICVILLCMCCRIQTMLACTCRCKVSMCWPAVSTKTYLNLRAKTVRHPSQIMAYIMYLECFGAFMSYTRAFRPWAAQSLSNIIPMMPTTDLQDSDQEYSYRLWYQVWDEEVEQDHAAASQTKTTILFIETYNFCSSYVSRPILLFQRHEVITGSIADW